MHNLPAMPTLVLREHAARLVDRATPIDVVSNQSWIPRELASSGRA
jgi:hypothetical protein